MIQAKDDNTTCRRSCCRGTASRPASHWEPRQLPTWPHKSQEERGPRSPGSRKLTKMILRMIFCLLDFELDDLAFHSGDFLVVSSCPGNHLRQLQLKSKPIETNSSICNRCLFIDFCLQNCFYQQLRSAKRCQLDRSKSSCLQKVLSFHGKRPPLVVLVLLVMLMLLLIGGSDGSTSEVMATVL